MKPLKPIEQKYWQSYVDSLTPEERPLQPHVEAGFAGSPSITDDLLQLYLAGKKTAGSSIAEDFMAMGDPLPKVGDYWIYLDSKGELRCILRTEKVVFHKFKDMPVEVAIAEGEGDLSLEYWRRVHSEFYFPHLSDWGISQMDDATVVTEYFEIVYK
jgi:uncharacterized protein YhfF